ncbi:MAG TPA: PrgI family protein [Patescibacteria group bacterium]|nr:PrgI family protein [Patescibacteria group bacterium]
MIETIVPAQVTTVEDKVAANLTVKQLFILIIATITDLLIFILIPTYFKLTIFKICLILSLSLIALVAILKIKDDLVLNWLILLSKYYLRPKIIIYTKKDICFREDYRENKKSKKTINTALQNSMTIKKRNKQYVNVT